MKLDQDLSMGVTLERERHIYTVAGLVIPSVSEIILPASAIHYGGINRKVMATAAERGREVHRAIDEEKEFGFSLHGEETGSYVTAYKEWLSEQKGYEHIASETIICHKQKLFAGTVDELGMVGMKHRITDFKTSAQPAWGLWALQLTGYAMALSSHWDWMHLSDIELYVLWITGGKTVYKKLAPNVRIFTACMDIARYMKETDK